MPVPICPRKDSEQGLILRGIKCQTAPSSHVRKRNSRLGILIILPSQHSETKLKNWVINWDRTHDIHYTCLLINRCSGLGQQARRKGWLHRLVDFHTSVGRKKFTSLIPNAKEAITWRHDVIIWTFSANYLFKPSIYCWLVVACQPFSGHFDKFQTIHFSVSQFFLFTHD